MSAFTDDMRRALAEHLAQKMTNVFIRLTQAPPIGTPIDTGEARNDWQLDISVPLDPKITNSARHIRRLNDGWSKQSPAGFVEAARDAEFR